MASGGPATLDAIGSYRAQEWKLWAMKGTGTGFWCYGPGGDGFTSWNTFAADTELYSPAYVGVDRVDDGKHWLAIIEGIQDYEYLRMLRDRIAELEKAGPQSPVLDRAGGCWRRCRRRPSSPPTRATARPSTGRVSRCWTY